MTLTYKVDATQANRILDEWRKASGKSMEAALSKQGRETAWSLWKGFKRISPKPSSIASAAEGRGYRMGRQGSSFVPSISGVSDAAYRRASKLIGEEGGMKAAYFKVSDNEGVPRVRRARFAKKRLKVLKGGRHGNRFSKSARTLSQLSEQERLALDAKAQGLKMMNKRALAVAFEIAYRARAAKGGTLAWQWLPKEYRRRSSATVKKGPLVASSKRGKKMGEVNFTLDPKGKLVGITLSGLLPGTAEADAKYNVVSPALQESLVQMQRNILYELEKRGMKK